MLESQQSKSGAMIGKSEKERKKCKLKTRSLRYQL